MKVGSVFTVKVRSGSTHAAFDWGKQGMEIPDSGNKFLKGKCVQIVHVKGDNCKVNVYDMTDDVCVMKGATMTLSQVMVRPCSYRPVKIRSKGKKGKKSKKRRRHKGSRKKRRTTRKSKRSKK